MPPHLIAVVLASVAAARKRSDPRRRAEARRHGIGFVAWLLRWSRYRRACPPRYTSGPIPREPLRPNAGVRGTRRG